VIVNSEKQERDRISSFLANKDNIEVLAHGKDGYDAIKLIGSLKPDIAIIDAHLEYIEGVKIPPLIRARSPATSIAIMTSRITDDQLYRAVVNEVSALIYREKDIGRLTEIIKCVLDGGCYISPWLAARVLHFFSGNVFPRPFKNNRKRNPEASANFMGFSLRTLLTGTTLKLKGIGKFTPNEDPAGYLSKMELKILTCIGEGYTSAEISRNLDLVSGTVRNYVSNIMRKTGMNSRSQMVRYAFRYGLVPMAPK